MFSAVSALISLVDFRAGIYYSAKSQLFALEFARIRIGARRVYTAMFRRIRLLLTRNTPGIYSITRIILELFWHGTACFSVFRLNTSE